MTEQLLEKLKGVNDAPGVYLMKDAAGRIIYVGKAASLKKRLASYFKNAGHHDIKTGVLVKKIKDFETIITATASEALMLESNLIKRHRPRYNVILKDDKRYPALRLDLSHPYPNIEFVRKIEKDGALYFGPYTSPGALYRTLKVINKTFKLRKCKDGVFKSRTRPCINYQIGGCLGPCCLDVPKSVYDEMVNEVILFLKGRTPELIKKVKTEMNAAAAAFEFEKAAALRDKMFALERVAEQHVAVARDFGDRDVFAVARSSESAVVTLMTVRNGYLIGSRHFEFTETLGDDSAVLESFIRQYYDKGHAVPKEVLTSAPLESADSLAAHLREMAGVAVHVLHPRRGEKVRLVAMALRNAENEMERRTDSDAEMGRQLERLQKRLHLLNAPRRIECFDNSNLQGNEPVSAMVVFENGAPFKSGYRKYKIRSVPEQNDYAYMKEVLTRRYGKGEASEPFPDLLLVDGGKGQLNIATAVLAEIGVTGRFGVAGIAKRDKVRGEPADKIYLPNRANPVNMPEDLRLLLERIRDEAHRFVISFHRKRRRKGIVSSALDGIPGLGPKRRKALLVHFGGINKIRAATPKEMAAAPGINEKLAREIYRRLNPSSRPDS